MRNGLLLGAGIALTMLPLPALGAGLTKDECIAASEDGQDLRRAGKISAATKRFLLCTHESCPAPVRTDCESRAREADRAQPTVRFVARDRQGTPVHDLTPLAALNELERLNIAHTAVTDLTPLAGLNLSRLILTPGKIVTGLDAIRSMSSLRELDIEFEGDRPARTPDQFWSEFDAGLLTSEKSQSGVQIDD